MLISLCHRFVSEKLFFEAKKDNYLTKCGKKDVEFLKVSTLFHSWKSHHAVLTVTNNPLRHDLPWNCIIVFGNFEYIDILIEILIVPRINKSMTESL